MSVGRRNYIVLLIALLVSHAALTLHVTTHIAIDQTNCEYCSGQGNPPHALAPAVHALLPPVETPFSSPAVESTCPKVAYNSCRQRGPPAIA